MFYEKTVDQENNLVLTKSVVKDCTQVTYNDQAVCIDAGLTLNFRCKYQLGEKIVSSEVSVSGQDEIFDAEGTGELKYTMVADASVQIGKPITVSITPMNPGLVYAAIKNCQ